MKTAWEITRAVIGRPDGQHRWDVAYQFLLEWSSQPEFALNYQPAPDPLEDHHESCLVCTGFNHPPTPDADD